MMTNQEINEAVARKLGWICKENMGAMGVGTMWVSPESRAIDIPDYVHSIQAAWEIWEKLVSDNYDCQFYSSWDRPITCFHATHKAGIDNQLHAEADTAPMAICLAFLKL